MPPISELSWIAQLSQAGAGVAVILAVVYFLKDRRSARESEHSNVAAILLDRAAERTSHTHLLAGHLERLVSAQEKMADSVHVLAVAVATCPKKEPNQ